MSSAVVKHASAGQTAPPYQPLVTLAAAYMAGIVVDRCWPCPMEGWWAASALGLAAWLCLWRAGASRLAACSLLAAVAGLGAARHHQHWMTFLQDDVGRYASAAPEPICFEAVALERPRWRPAPAATPLTAFERGDQMRFDARIVRVRDGAAWRTASGKSSLIVEGHLPRIDAGDRLLILGEFQRPQPPLNPGEYDFAAAERTDRKLCRVSVDHPDAVSLVARGGAIRLARGIHAARDGGDRLLWTHVGPERAGLASALLLGSREQLDPERREPFFITGMMHILTISGVHVGILAAGFWLLTRLTGAPRRGSLIAAIVLVVLYALLTGSEPPVVRAAILIVIVCAGRWIGKPVLTFNTLAAAALVVLAINPAELFQPGPQLSFLAFGSLVLASVAVAKWRNPPEDPLDRLILQTRPWPRRATRTATIRVAQLAACNCAVWLAVLPLAMHRFHLASGEAIVLNLVLWVPVSIALFSGFAVLVFGALFPPGADACGAVCDGSLALIETIVRGAEGGLNLHAWTPGPPGWWVIGCYAAMAAWFSFPQLRPPRRWTAALLTGWAALGLLPPDHGFAPAPNETTSFSSGAGILHAGEATPDIQPWACTFISVGHGVSVLVEFPEGRTLLYDAGSLGSPTFSARGIAGVLWSRGLKHVDAVVLSHADADHYNALPELLEMFSFGVVYVSPVMFENETPPLAALRQSIVAAGIPLKELSMGDRLSVGEGVLAEVLHPPPRGIIGTDNANSIVLHIEAQDRRLLLTGDLEDAGLDSLLAELPVAYDVALAPHHGSTRSNPPGFAAWATPQVTVISGGMGDISPAVKAAYGSTGGRVFHTAEDGAVRVTLTRSALHVQTWRGEQSSSSSATRALHQGSTTGAYDASK